MAIEDSVRLDLNGTGWARYEIRAPAGTPIHVALDAPSGYDLCDPFFSRVDDHTTADFVAFAVIRPQDPGSADWSLLHGKPWGWIDIQGNMDCAKTTTTNDEGETTTLIIGSAMSGMAITVQFGEAPPTATTPAALSQHPTLGAREPEAERTAAADVGVAYAAVSESWRSETAGGPRLVAAMAWQMHEMTTPAPMAHADLQSGSFSLTGVDSPREGGGSSTPFPGFGWGGMTAGYSTAQGYANGEEAVVATSERQTYAGVVTGARNAGLIVWELPLEPPQDDQTA